MTNKTIYNYLESLLIVALLALPFSGSAQQDSQYTQYMYNTQTVNPAYAGNRGLFAINGLYRTQWVGLDGAPTTMNLSLNSPIGEQGIGLGLDVVRDEIGPSIEDNMAVDISYSIHLSRETKLSFGIKGGLNVLDLDESKLNPDDPNEGAFDMNARLSPIVGIGFYLHDSERWYVGLSSPNLLKTKHYDDVQSSEVTEELHGYLIGGYVFDLNRTTKFKPAVLLKGVAGAPLAVDLSANFLFNEKLTLGAAYRLDAAVSALAGFQISDKLMIGYAYDYATTELGNYNAGSHEIFLRFELFSRVRGTVNPRFF